MSTEMPIRPSRRPAARRRIVADDSDEEDHRVPSQQNEDEAEYTFPPKTTPRRQPRRKTAEPTSIAPSTTRGRRTKTGESIEPSQIFSPEGNAAPEPPSPSRGSSPRKRTSVTSSRRTRKSSATDIPEVPPLPTPKPSQSPEPPASQNTPLADITSATVNNRGAEQLQPSEVSSQKPMERPLEEPKDILLKSQNMAIPGPPPAPSGPTSRIVITYLILNNFKSYAGRQEVGPFHASFSSVVGPNGSGKSNVIDSLLFVFGFRASKMRQGKISALIHNSAAFPNLEFCEVEVHFEEVIDLPGGKHEIVPNSALVISRRAYKNNTSKYFINGKESNFTVVTTLLRDRGVDLDHKRFLILQGEVESIAQMKPKAANEHDDGLLEYLEDIIGTSKYKTPIEESAAELETLNEVCHEKSNRVQHVEKEKNSLEDKKNKALAYIREENDLATKQSALYQIYISECEDNLKVTEEAITQMQAQLKEELEKHQGNEDGIKQMEKLYKKGAKEYEAMEAETQALLKEMAKIDKENVKFEEKKKFLAGKQKKFEKALQGSRLGGSEAETVIKNCLEDVARSSEQIAELEKSMKQEEEELATIREGLKGKTQAFSDQIAVKQKSLEPWKAKINEKQSAIAVAQSELDILRERNNAGETKLKEVQAKIDEIKRNGQAKEQELEGCKARREELTQHTEAVEKELNKLSQKEAGYRNQVSGARQKADEARASLSNTQTQGNVLTGLMRLKESGRVEGFHGRLGNLGAIDEKYDVAISTACPSLDNLVVDSVEVGQQCIDYLRKNNLGRAQFILLDRLPKRDLSSINTPEGVPRLFDLVKSKHDKFRPAFFSVLQNTLVADDLAQANRIAYGAQRWRVVTLDGQLIDKSGTMSGGGTRVAKGAMSSKLAGEVTRERVAKLEGDREALEQAFQIFLDRQRELETSLRESKEEIGPLETTMQKIAMEIQSCARQLNDARRRRQEIAEENQPSPEDNDRMASLEKKIVGLNKEIEKLHAETAGVEAEIKELQDKIMEVGGVRLRAQKARVDGIREQIDTLNEEISTAEVAKTKAEKQVAKQFKAMKEAEKELESVAEEAQKLEEAIKTQTRDSSGSRDKAEEAQEALESKKDQLAALKKELDEKRDELNQTRAVEIEMRNKLEENQKVFSENQKRGRYWLEKLNKLSLQKISDLGIEPQQGVEGVENNEQTQQEAIPEELPTYTKDELADMNKETLKGEIAILEEKTQNVSVELGVLAEYRRRVEEHAARSEDLQTAVTARDTAKKRCDDLRRLRLEGFMEGFSTISLRLKEMYQMITMGGNAELELVDSLDPFSEGILFSVMPPKKSWKNISNLSGGEKTLSSLALVFALHHYKPTPLYVMDEIDAALDFKNVSIVAGYIKERTKNAQFIVISLRNNMFELAARLVGVYKVNHMTKSVAVENRDYIRRQVQGGQGGHSVQSVHGSQPGQGSQGGSSQQSQQGQGSQQGGQSQGQGRLSMAPATGR